MTTQDTAIQPLLPVPNRLYTKNVKKEFYRSIASGFIAVVSLAALAWLVRHDDKIDDSLSFLLGLALVLGTYLGILVCGLSIYFGFKEAKEAAAEERDRRSRVAFKADLDALMATEELTPLADSDDEYVVGTNGHIPFRDADGVTVYVQAYNSSELYAYQVVVKRPTGQLPYNKKWH